MKRARNTLVVVLATGAIATMPASISPAGAADFNGFSTKATATPLKIEVYEQGIPIPADPQVELAFSYTHVQATSGPLASARASALWPGDAVGEGWKAIGDEVGLPAALTQDGYPLQVNAQSPGETTSAAQELFPGMVARVNAGDERATARAGYGTGEHPSEGELGSDPESTDPLTALASGDLSVLGDALTGTSSGTADDPAPGSPLGGLSALVDASGMSSVSTTDYSGDAVVARATSRLGELSLVAGLVKLTGVEVVARTTSNLASGAKTTYKVRVGGMTIAGQSYAMTPDGIEGGGSKQPIPGLPTEPTAALKALGISIEMPKPQVTSDGAHGGVAARGVVVTIDTGPLRSKLPTLPLGDIVNTFPDDAAQLKSVLLALNEAHPKLVVSLGALATDAMTVAGIDPGAVPAPAATGTTGTTGTGGSTGGSAGTPGAVGSPGEVPSAATTPTSTTPVQEVSAVPGLPPLGSVPGMLTLLGLVLAGLAGWYLRRVGGLLFGAGNACLHGLKAGVPDLRKA